MKGTFKRLVIGIAALTLLGTQISFAADQARLRTRTRTQDRTCIKDGSGTQTKNTYQNRKMNQTRNVSGTATQSGR